jgi:predicted transposase/invertase (TIGR01784 family)
MEPPTPHDALLRGVFSHPEHAAGMIRHMMRRSLAARFDWSTLRLVSGSFVDAALRHRHSDVLYTVKCDGKEVFLYLLLEHQSTDDPLMPYRLLVYVVRIWERYVRENPKSKRLPAIVPMVVHHSREGWTSPTSFQALIDLPEDVLRVLGPHMPDFTFLLDDLRATSDASLRRRAMSMLGRLALFCLRHSSEPGQIVQRLARWVELVRGIRAAPGGKEALELIWRYVLVISEPAEPEELVDQLLLVVGEEGKEEIVTAGEKLMERGRNAERREMLLELLRKRFGTVTAQVEARIRAADPAQLKRWLLRVVEVPTLADVLADG